MKPKIFLATYFDNYNDALKHATKQNVRKKKDIFEVITNGKGFFVVSKNIYKKRV